MNVCNALLQLCANDDNETIYGKINVSLPILEIKGAQNGHQFGNKSEWSKGFNVTMGHCHKNVSFEMRKAEDSSAVGAISLSQLLPPKGLLSPHIHTHIHLLQPP